MNRSEQQIQSVWDQGEAVEKTNPRKWRKDACGAWICRDHYGNRNSSFGWEIDHIAPAENGGTDDLPNLRPVQWKNAALKQEGKLTCPVTASGGINFDFSE
jgi:hypothetical protein